MMGMGVISLAHCNSFYLEIMFKLNHRNDSKYK